MPKLPKQAQLPADLGLDACPWLDEYIEFSAMWSPRSFDGYHEVIGLAVLSTIAARRVVIERGGSLYTNLYFMIVGRTTLQPKSTPMQIAIDLTHKLGLGYLLLPDECTPQRMVLEMCKKLPENYDKLSVTQKEKVKLQVAFAGQRGWFYDEFGENLQQMMKKDGPYGLFRSLLRRLDDTGPEYSRATIERGKEVIERPYLAFLGALTPADLIPFAGNGALLWRDGFFARICMIAPPDGLIKNNRFPKGIREFPDSLLQPLKDWHNRLGIPTVNIALGSISGIDYPLTESLELSDEAWDAYYAYDEALREILQSQNNPDLDGNYGRLAEKALRKAGLFASLAGSSKIAINHWARAQEIAERFRSYLHELQDQLVPAAQAHTQLTVEQKVYKAIQNKNFPTRREIHQFTGVDYLEIDLVLGDLIAQGSVILEKIGRAYRYRFQ